MASTTLERPHDPSRTQNLGITGMTCAGCAGRVERALRTVPGVEEADVNLALDTAEIRGDVTLDELIAAVSAAGFGARPLDLRRPGEAAETASGTGGNEMTELVIAALLTAPLVLQMIPMAFGLAWHLSPWLEWLLATPVQFWIGRRFYKGAVKAIVSRTGTMDLLVAIGTSAAYLYSLWLYLRMGPEAAGHLYFEASAVVITLVVAGKVLEGRAKRSASEALRELMALRPEKALRLLDGGGTEEVDIGSVATGDRLLVRPGDRLPVDGVIVDGQGEIDESLVTGESMPVPRKTGENVVAGSVNGEAALEIEATRVGEDTTLARIASLVEHAQVGKAPVQRLVDRISAVFVPLVLVIATLAFIGWYVSGAGFETALVAFVSVLVIACPCALGLATPTALVAGTGAAARAGILIRDIETLERAQSLDMVVFDKTGTLTLGHPVVTDIVASRMSEDDLLRIAASIQSRSEHPLGRAVVEAARERNLVPVETQAFTARAGAGVEARIEGSTWRIGQGEFAGAGVDAELATIAAELENRARTVSFISRDGTPEGLLGFADTAREDAGEAIAGLTARGIEVALLTGDNKATAETIGRELGIDRVHARLRPQGKVETIRSLVEDGRKVAMVGDGINDAPALAAADVGIAMGSGSDVALETAGITLMRPRPALVAAAIDIARKTGTKIRQNLFWAFIYNVIGIPVAASGHLSPALAGTAMALSSVSVVTNSLFLKRWRPSREKTQ
ncbi:MAG: heavy metal translocating P-type ATPase [Geminicoccaceae bacterium]